MARLSSILLSLRALLRPTSTEKDLDEELRFHLERETQERVRRGMSPDEARRGALRDFGGVERFKDECRDERRVGLLTDLGKDVRYAVRSLRKNPAFTAVALVTLALGIGANTAIFSVVNGVVLRALPYADPERLVAVWNSWNDRPGGQGSISPAEYFDYIDIKAFEHFGVYSTGISSLTGDGEPERVPSAGLSSGVLPALGVAPALGRHFTPGEDVIGNDVVILGDGLWRRRFGSSPDVIGKRITLNAIPRTVIGVMPPGFRVPDELSATHPTEIFVPLGLNRDSVTIRGSHFLSGVARVARGTTVAQASASIRAIAERFTVDYPKDYPTQMSFTAAAVPLRASVIGEVRPTLLILLGAVGFVLLIACANMASLVLSRTEARRREIALRSALGAHRQRLVRQFLVESVVIALAGGLLGTLLAVWGTKVLIAMRPPGIPRLDDVSVDLQVLGFALGVSVVTGLLFGIAPAAQAGRVDVQSMLRDGSRGATAGASGQRMRRVLVVGEVSIALILLLGAGLLTKSFMRLMSVEPGFRVDGVLTVPISLPTARYRENERVIGFYQQVVERVRGLPGVEAAGAVAGVPLVSERGDIGIGIEGRPIAEGEHRPQIDWQVVTPGYFRAIGMRLLRGREIEETDTENTPGVVVINETMARRLWPNEDPLGQRFTLSAGPRLVTVVGIVADVRQTSLSSEVQKEMYFAHTQFRFWGGGSILRALSLVARTTGEATALARAIRAEVAAMDPDLPLGSFRTMEELRGESVSRPRFLMTLLSVFSAVSLAIALVGIYGVMAYAVSQRRKEIGIRVALGARAASVAGMIVRQGMSLALAGIAIGLVAGFGLTRLMSGLLFSVSPTDPATLTLVAVSVALVALLASYVPAYRATRVDPIEALRSE